MDPSRFSVTTNACTQSSQVTGTPDRISKTVRDAAGQVTQQRVAVGTSEEAAEVSSTYAASGQVETLTDAENNRTTYVYDGHNRLSRTRYPVATQGQLTSSTTDYEELTYDAGSNAACRRPRLPINPYASCRRADSPSR